MPSSSSYWAWRGDGSGAPLRHQELRARALPGLKLQQADIQRGVLAQTAAGQSRAEGSEVAGHRGRDSR